ncbi:hypothetical protein C8J57DRAFT_279368 [Mycena rebaudengoi]|nr:hypothetical protein C8J57DRAFT_279368 [Mycena rebaudengoi]
MATYETLPGLGDIPLLPSSPIHGWLLNFDLGYDVHYPRRGVFLRPLHSLVSGLISRKILVTVGAEANSPGGIYQFSPNNFNAPNGTVINFQFNVPGNHSIVQSTFANPCEGLPFGFNSGTMTGNSGSDFPVWTFTVEDEEKPMFFFCQQSSPVRHCSEGMVGAINARKGMFTAFQANAKSLAVEQTTSTRSSAGRDWQANKRSK